MLYTYAIPLPFSLCDMLGYQRFKSLLDLHEIWYRRFLQEVIFVNISPRGVII
jgi:hypothetical protein